MSKHHIVGTNEMVQPSGKTKELQPLENLEELGLRAVACKHWRWMPGMLVTFPRASSAYLETYVSPFKGHKVTLRFRYTERDDEPSTGTLPDLLDPATLGCLLALVREALGEPTAFVEKHPIGAPWQVHTVDGGIFAQGYTEEAALVAALEAAP